MPRATLGPIGPRNATPFPEHVVVSPNICMGVENKFRLFRQGSYVYDLIRSENYESSTPAIPSLTHAEIRKK